MLIVGPAEVIGFGEAFVSIHDPFHLRRTGSEFYQLTEVVEEQFVVLREASNIPGDGVRAWRALPQPCESPCRCGLTIER